MSLYRQERKRYVSVGQGLGMQEDRTMSTATELLPPVLSQADVASRFHRLAQQWKEQSRYLSNTAQIAILKPYQRIIGMGYPVVPLILAEIQREPRQWFWALEAITEENPVPPAVAGNVRDMAQAWVDWGKKKGFKIL